MRPAGSSARAIRPIPPLPPRPPRAGGGGDVLLPSRSRSRSTMLADLDLLRARLSITSTRDDGILQASLDTAIAWVQDRVMADRWSRPDVQEAVILMASRLFKRRQSPEGVAGWDDLGVVRIVARDPDVEALLSQHLDAAWVMGIG